MWIPIGICLQFRRTGVIHVIAVIAAKGERTMSGNPTVTANTEAGAPVEQPAPAQKPGSAAQKAHVAPSKAKSGKPGHPGEEGQQRLQAGQVAQEGNWRPPGNQGRQGPRPAEANRGRHAEGSHKATRLAGAVGPWVPVRRGGQEDGADGHVHQGRGGGSPLLGQGLKVNDSVPLGRRGSPRRLFFVRSQSRSLSCSAQPAGNASSSHAW